MQASGHSGVVSVGGAPASAAELPRPELGASGGLAGDFRGVLDTPAEETFDDLVSQVAEVFGTPFAQLSIVTADRVWLKAAITGAGSSSAPENTFCATVAKDKRALVVSDAARSRRFADHPAVLAGGRFYAGVPLIAGDGTVWGSLCAWDVQPRSPTEGDLRSLERLGAHAVALLEQRRLAVRLAAHDGLLAASASVLEMILDGSDLPSVLDSLALAVQDAMPATKCSILLLDGAVLHHVAGPSLPADYRDAIDGVRIGPAVGSCGTAAFTGQTVIVPDVATDPRWADYYQYALAAGLRACWSIPIVHHQHHVLGTFALYYADVRSPTADELLQMWRWVKLAELAISRAAEVTALRDAAVLDGLTGLVNRSEALRLLHEATADPQRRLAVLFLDLDQFKFVNDTLGHAAGDQFLKIVADRLRNSLSPNDTAARFGGDEFLMLCQVDGAEQAQQIAARVLAAVQKPATIYGHMVSLSGSIGIALHRPAGQVRTADLIGDADLAMYAAKRSGRNCVALFTEDLRQHAAGRLSLEGELSKALASGELDCDYQPIFHLQTGKLVAVEALLRWTSPTHGVVPPYSFIPAAEASGHIFALGEFVLRRACTQLAALRAAGDPAWRDVVISVNVSPRQLRDPGLADLIRSVLIETGVPATNLGIEVTESSFEVTESSFMDEGGTARTTLGTLRESGVRVAVDDFGTGYSSLAQLKNLPADVLKIDRQFISHIDSDPADFGIVQAILALASTLGLHVIAEGIETAAQLRCLTDLGCACGQGYLLGRPGPAGALSPRFLSPVGPIISPQRYS